MVLVGAAFGLFAISAGWGQAILGFESPPLVPGRRVSAFPASG